MACPLLNASTEYFKLSIFVRQLQDERASLIGLSTANDKNDKGFDLLRLIGALLVLYGHAFPLAGQPAPGFLGNHIQTVGVKIFFVISGYLITKSWLNDPSLPRFAKKRFLRIFPGLAANVAFVA